MKVKTFIREQDRLVPAEVELTFVPGLPTIQMIGLPDQLIKESVHRIRTALRSQNVSLPKSQQLIVNIRPNHLKKHSRGIELAIAYGIMRLTESVLKNVDLETAFFYGELGIHGEVYAPEDLYQLSLMPENTIIVTGIGHQFMHYPTVVLRELQSVHQFEISQPSQDQLDIVRPEISSHIQFSVEQAQWMKVIALGEHPTLIAGTPGTGKSTLAKALINFLSAPNSSELREIKSLFPNLNWRPVMMPHHSASPLAMVGGGVPPRRGEIGRAHRGLLILDEYLEFSSQVQEALRGPLEDQWVRIARGQSYFEYPADVVCVATTNLCPCGKWMPQKIVDCGRSQKRCSSYRERIVGPVMDRFHLLVFSQKVNNGQQTVASSQILLDLERARGFRKEMSARYDSYLKPAKVWTDQDLNPWLEKVKLNIALPEEIASERRRLAILRVARTLADLDCEEMITSLHIERALLQSYHHFLQLQASMS